MRKNQIMKMISGNKKSIIGAVALVGIGAVVKIATNALNPNRGPEDDIEEIEEDLEMEDEEETQEDNILRMN